MNRKASGIPIQINNNCVIASVHLDLDGRLLDLFRSELLSYCAKECPKGIILDVSGQRLIDNKDFEKLRQIADSAKMMGYSTIFSGFRSEVVASLVSLEVNLDRIIATRNLDEAFLILIEKDTKIEPEELPIKEDLDETEDYEI